MPPEPAAVQFWGHFCEQTSRLVTEAGEALGSHLRERPFRLRNVSRDPHHGAAELEAGRTVLRMECPLLCLRPNPGETRLAEVFGEGTPLVRIYVYRERCSRRPTVEAWIAADPDTGCWVSGHPDLGPVPTTDLASLETFVWSLLIDSGR